MLRNINVVKIFHGLQNVIVGRYQFFKINHLNDVSTIAITIVIIASAKKIIWCFKCVTRTKESKSVLRLKNIFDILFTENKIGHF